ncbi:YbeD-like protein [Gracilaria domingensis]|nr:YbeD-like protein [Gracilaria domingensis]
MAAFVKAFVARGALPMFSRRHGLTPLVGARHHNANRRGRITMIRGFPNNFNNDFANNSGNRRVFDELVDFPCVFTFKVIGMAQGDFMGDIVDSVATALETDKKYLKTSYRDKGKYRSITLKAPVNTAEQIYSVYAAIDRDPRVKFKF